MVMKGRERGWMSRNKEDIPLVSRYATQFDGAPRAYATSGVSSLLDNPETTGDLEIGSAGRLGFPPLRAPRMGT